MANILLVEDNQGLGNLAAGLLSPNGHVVKHVLSAEAAAESGTFAAELILLDHGLPGQQGIRHSGFKKNFSGQQNYFTLKFRGSRI